MAKYNYKLTRIRQHATEFSDWGTALIVAEIMAARFNENCIEAQFEALYDDGDRDRTYYALIRQYNCTLNKEQSQYTNLYIKDVK